MGLGKNIYSLSCWVALLAVVACIFCYYPAPNPSKILKNWRREGGLQFQYEGKRIFMKEAYNEKSANPKAVLILLHGFPTSSFDWYKVWHNLTGYFGHVIAVDFLGYGFSNKPVSHNYTVEEQADLLEAIAVARDLRSVHILAHDYGDTVAQEMLHRLNNKKFANGMNIQSVCLLNGGLFPDTHFPRLSQKILLSSIGKYASNLMTYFTFRVSFAEVFGVQTQPTEREYRDMWHAIRHNGGNYVTHELVRYVVERQKNRKKWTEALTKTSVPLHLIYGPADPVNPPEPFLSKFKERVPGATVAQLAPEIGHYPQLEAPKATMEAYVAFLARRVQDFDTAPDHVRPLERSTTYVTLANGTKIDVETADEYEIYRRDVLGR